MKLTDSQLFKAWEFALEEMHEKAKKPGEPTGTYLARCWFEGLIRSVNYSGYDICLVKKDPSVKSL